MGRFLGGRNPTPEDTQDLLCGPTLPEMDPERSRALEDAASRANHAFCSMVTYIIMEKEKDERLLETQAGPRRA